VPPGSFHHRPDLALGVVDVSSFIHRPHPHVAARKLAGPVKLRSGRLGFNERLAVRGTAWFGTMWAFYAFVIYGALGAVFVAEQAALLYWSNWIQLWSLPLIGVGAVVLGRAAEKRNQQAFDDTEALLHGQDQIAQHLAAQDNAIADLIAALAADQDHLVSRADADRDLADQHLEATRQVADSLDVLHRALGTNPTAGGPQ